MLQNLLQQKIEKGTLYFYWLGGAGFVLQSADITLAVDPYLSNSCQGDNEDFKRLIPPPITAQELDLDYLMISHEHGDHLDTESVPMLVKEKTKLITNPTVADRSERLGVKSDRIIRMERNRDYSTGGLSVRTVFSDHGEYSPDQLGLIIELAGRRIYYTADTCYRWDLPRLVDLGGPIDLLVVPINGRYGNPNSLEAAHIVEWVKPKMTIPCHYWLFKEHNGDPGSFYSICREKCSSTTVKIAAIAERISL